MYGQGLNSIQNRFTLLIGVLVALSLGAMLIFDHYFAIHAMNGWLVAALAMLATLVPMATTYFFAGRLTDTIEQLRKSTEAIAGGDYEHVVSVDCACEVGGLADNFRKMVQRLNANIQRINTLAYTDAVTHLPNRLALSHMLTAGLAKTGAERLNGALLFVNLDNFSQINESINHEAGDQLLREASQRILHEALRKRREDIDPDVHAPGEGRDAAAQKFLLAHFAGDEFVAFLPETVDAATLALRAQTIIDCLTRPFQIQNQMVRVGASVGIAILNKDSSDPAEIVSFADFAMHDSKQRGGNMFTFFNTEMVTRAQARARTASELAAGIEGGEITLFYQPIFEAGTLRVSAVEALARWRHPTRGLVGPHEFIQIAEDTGLIEPLGREVLRLAVAQCRAWLDAGLERQISINVSHCQFERADFARHVLDVAEAAGVPGRLIELELTETVAMANPTLSQRHLDLLKQHGVSIAIDDFGTGFSNLSHLAQLSFDTLKIDRSMISTLEISSKSRSIVYAIVQMANAMGHRTIAEGVETRAQFEYLASHGCDLAQGFLLGRPMPPEALDAWYTAFVDANAQSASRKVA